MLQRYLGVLVEARPRIQGMIRDAVWAGLLQEQILERSSRQPPPLISKHSTAMRTAKLYVQKAAQARRSLAANKWRIAGTKRRKPDHRIP